MSETIEIIEDRAEDTANELNSSRSKMSIRRFGVFGIAGISVIALVGYGSYLYISKNFNFFGKNTAEKTKVTRTYSAAPDTLGKYQPPKPKPLVEEKEPPKVEEVIRPQFVEQTPTPLVTPVAEDEEKETVLDKRFNSKLNSYLNINKSETRVSENLQENKGYSSKKNLKVNKVKLMTNIDYVLVKGMKIPCTIENNIVSEQTGYTSCIINEDVYSSNARVLLIEKGSKITGEYSSKRVKNGDSRLAIIWDRIITPYDVVIKLDSPSVDRLGATGITGYVDNRWGKRIGSALLVSLMSDALKITANNSKDAEVIIESETSETSQKLAEKILDNNIKLKPIIYITEGEMINIYVAKDIDMSEVYNVRVMP